MLGKIKGSLDPKSFLQGMRTSVRAAGSLGDLGGAMSTGMAGCRASKAVTTWHLRTSTQNPALELRRSISPP